MDWLEELQHNGFGRLRLSSSEELLDVAHRLGSPIRLRPDVDVIQELSPCEANTARPRSLSALHGTGAFPLHTDGAHLRTPPRYIVMRCSQPGAGGRSTFVADSARLHLSEDDWSTLHRAVFVVRGGGTARPFLASLLKRSTSGERQIRFDAGCMAPAHPSFASAGNLLAQALEDVVDRISWRKDDAVVIDNARCLHGRSIAQSPDGDRTLQRISVAAV